jgi:hypothetical protein
MRQAMAKFPSGTRAFGTLTIDILAQKGCVVGFDVARGLYNVLLDESRSGEPIGVKPEHFITKKGSAVIVEGLDAAPEWNGKRGLVESYDAAKGRYRLLMKGRGSKPLGVRVACCKLEFAVEQEQREQEATRRARVEANVRAALAARESEPEPQPELEPQPEPEPEPGTARA